jgi:FkbH-like protein
MTRKPYKIGLLADFNTQNLSILLQKNPAAGVVCTGADYGQTLRLLLDAGDPFWAEALDALVLWTLPQLAAPGFQKILSFEEVPLAGLWREVDAFCALVKKIPANVRTIFIPSWVMPGGERGLGPMNLAHNLGPANVLMQMNLRLAEQFAADPRVVLLDASPWQSGAGALSPKLWYLSKTPFANAVFQEAAGDIIAALEGIHGRAKKVVVLDLDNTLWGGILGDDGWEQLRLGGHDAVGEALVDFQKGLKRLTQRGVLLAIASKNEEATALNAIRSHPEMILKLEDFAAWKINWNDKAANIAELMSGLNLGLDSAVFLDDSAFERARVQEALPQVLVPELPADPMLYPSFLARLKCFDNPFISREDRARTTMYVADRQRTSLQSEFGSLDEWLQALGLRVIAEPLTAANLERAAQLFNKTNQMNLSTRRLTAAELLAWAGTEGHHLWTFRVADKFGDYGLCGIGSLVQQDSHAQLVDFLLSCRVMGRGVEETMMCLIAQKARSLGGGELRAEYVPTAKNQPVEKWLSGHPKLKKEGATFRGSLENGFEFPKHVQTV